MATGVENLFEIAHRIDAALLEHFARKNVTRGGQRIAKGKGLTTQIVKAFDRTIRARNNRGIIVGNALAFRFENHFDVRFVFREHVRRWRHKGNVELIDTQGFNHARVIRRHEGLNLHTQLFTQDFYDRLGILHHLLRVLGRDKSDAQRLGFSAGVAARINDQPHQ